MNEQRPTLHSFRVRVGHWQIRVKAHNPDEAIVVARRQLSHELPRLYDVIRSLVPNRFEVEEAA